MSLRRRRIRKKLLGVKFWCGVYRPAGNEFELIRTVKMETRHPVQGSFGNEFSSNRSVIIAELWWPEIARRWKNAILCVFGKTTPYGEIFKILFRKDSSRHRSMCYVQISWNLADWKSVMSCVIYVTKKTKFRLVLQPLLLHRSRPKSARANPTMYSECSRFHPNRFTFGGVIPERVNTIRTGRKVFPTLGWSLASSRINRPMLC